MYRFEWHEFEVQSRNICLITFGWVFVGFPSKYLGRLNRPFPAHFDRLAMQKALKESNRSSELKTGPSPFLRKLLQCALLGIQVKNLLLSAKLEFEFTNTGLIVSSLLSSLSLHSSPTERLMQMNTCDIVVTLFTTEVEYYCAKLFIARKRRRAID